MNRLNRAFANRNRKALIAYVTAGYPSLEATLEVVPQLESWGCDVVELGIPFSDPLADGVTIQEASFRALQSGVTPGACLDLVSRLRQKVNIPLVFMTYFNPVLKYGPEAFCRSSAGAGVDGFIVPDLPPEEGREFEKSARDHNLDLIYLLAPTSTEERISAVAGRSRGFIYLVSLVGVTGARQALPQELEDFVTRVRKKAKQPLCMGFGISTPEQAHRVAQVADGIIVGSRLVQLMSEDSPLHLKAFIQELRQALD